MSRVRVDGDCGEIWEVYPSAMLEVSELNGELLCVEILDATEVLGDLLEPLKSGGEFVVKYVEGDLSVIKEALLELDEENEGSYKEYLIFKSDEEADRNTRLKQVRAALAPYLMQLRESTFQSTLSE